MQDQFNLKHKSDSHLVSDLKTLVIKERELLTQILEYLQEVADRKLYLKKGYSSLFAFLTGELGYSESAAQRRIQAMRLVKDLAEVEDKIERGTLSLSVASQIQSFLQHDEKKRKQENQKSLSSEEKLALVCQLEGTSARKCEEHLSRIAPEIALPKEKIRPITPEKTLVSSIFGKFESNEEDQ